MNSKKTIIIILVIILIAILLAAGWYCFIRQKKQTENSPALKETTAPPTTQEIPPKTKLYRNEQWGFEFRYPEGWKLKENSFYSPFSKFNLQGNLLAKDYNPFRPHFILNTVTLEFADRAIISFKNMNASISTITVDSINGSKYEYDFEGSRQIAIVLPFGKYKMILGTEKQYEDIFNQVIASFKFLK